MRPPGDSWSKERIALLEVLDRKGLSGSQIMFRLNRLDGERLTRNAVIGKLHRMKGRKNKRGNRMVAMKAPKPAPAPKPKKEPKPKRAQVRPVYSARTGMPVVAIDAPLRAPRLIEGEAVPEAAVPYLSLDRGRCRWIFNDAKDGPMCCGAPSAAAELADLGDVPLSAHSYCLEHWQRAHQPGALDRLRNREEHHEHG